MKARKPKRYTRRWMISSRPDERIFYVYAETREDALNESGCHGDAYSCVPAGYFDNRMNVIVGDPESGELQVPPPPESTPPPPMPRKPKGDPHLNGSSLNGAP